MNISVDWKQRLFLVAFALAEIGSAAGAESVDRNATAETIKGDVAQLVTGLSTHDADRVTAYDAPHIISTECGSTPTVGVEADREGFRSGFAHDPDWRVRLIEDTVAVAASGDYMERSHP